VILAGILLKLGSYGFMRFVIPLFSNKILNFFLPLIFLLCLISIIYGSLAVIKHLDLKKIIAYSSIVHMNSATIAIFINNNIALYGGLIAIVNHSLVSALLFFMVGLIDDRTGTRSLKTINGLINFNTLFTIIFFIAILANFSFPLLSTFIG
jgi:NADH:ubiquinone oxidoreductase subunit 4 (subunit M)